MVFFYQNNVSLAYMKRKKSNFIYKLGLVYFWFFLSLTLFMSLNLLLIENLKLKAPFLFLGTGSKYQKTASHYLLYSQLVSVPENKTIYKTQIISRDARVLIINRYLRKYQSPMLNDNINIASVFVEAADEYHLPWTLLPAIAQCESNLGKHTPPNCYNAWGYGIHSRGTLCFSSWQEGIRRVARGLSQDYISQGLVQPSKIMAKYTPVSNGSWASCVSLFSRKLEEGMN